MTFKRILLLVLLLAALLNAEDSFAQKDTKVVFVGKSTSASAKLALKGKSLSMTFKATASKENKLIGMTLDLGGCEVVTSLVLNYGKPYLTFKERPDEFLGFPVSATLSKNDFAASDFSQPCKPTFTSDGDLHVIDVRITLGQQIDSLAIEFNGAKLNSQQGEMSTGSIVLIATGSIGGVLLLTAGVVGVIVWFIRRKASKGKKQTAVKVSKKAPIVSKPVSVAIQVDSPAPKNKSPPAKKANSKAVSQEHAPKRSATQEKSEDTAEPAPSKPIKPKPTKSLSQEYFGPGQLITPTRAKEMSADEDKPEVIATLKSEEQPLEPTIDDFRKRGPSILPRALVHTEYLPKGEFPLLGKLLPQETSERRFEIFFFPDLEQLEAELRHAEKLVGHLFHARPGEMDFYWIADLWANINDLPALVKHVAEWKEGARQACDLPWAFTLISELGSLHLKQLIEGDRKVPLTLRQQDNVRTGVEWLKGKQKKASEKGDKKTAETIGKQIWRLEYLVGTVEERARLKEEGAIMGWLE